MADLTPEQEQTLSQVAGGLTRGPAEWALLKLIGAYMTKRYGNLIQTADREIYAKVLAAMMLREEERQAAIAEATAPLQAEIARLRLANDPAAPMVERVLVQEVERLRSALADAVRLLREARKQVIIPGNDLGHRIDTFLASAQAQEAAK